MNIAQLHRASLDATRVTVAGVRADQWLWPTPNEGWDVRTLVNHIVPATSGQPNWAPGAR